MAESSPNWHLYVLRCGDGSLYCGITTDVARRLEQHRLGKGARYTKGRGPLDLAAVWEIGSRSDALRAERIYKTLGRLTKEALLGATRVKVWRPSGIGQGNVRRGK